MTKTKVIAKFLNSLNVIIDYQKEISLEKF